LICLSLMAALVGAVVAAGALVAAGAVVAAAVQALNRVLKMISRVTNSQIVRWFCFISFLLEFGFALLFGLLAVEFYFSTGSSINA
jgi:hypothetical protein